MELKSDYSKVAGYKVNRQKSMAFLYTRDLKVKFKIENINIYVNTLQNEIGINLTKYV